MEKGSDGKYVSRVHGLSAVASFVVFELACESRLFAIEWADASLPTVYETNRRQKDVATLLDQAQVAKGSAIPVLPDFTWVRDLRVWFCFCFAFFFGWRPRGPLCPFRLSSPESSTANATFEGCCPLVQLCCWACVCAECSVLSCWRTWFTRLDTTAQPF